MAIHVQFGILSMERTRTTLWGSLGIYTKRDYTTSWNKAMKRWIVYGLVFWAGLWCGALYGMAVMNNLENISRQPNPDTKG